MQHTISNSPWDNTKGLMHDIAESASYLMKSRGTVGLIIDEKAHLKKETKYAGPARQYVGIIGKIDNCQLGVYAGLYAGKYSMLIDRRLYFSEELTNDKKRYKKVRIPLEKTVFKTKSQLAVEIIKEITSLDVEYDFIG